MNDGRVDVSVSRPVFSKKTDEFKKLLGRKIRALRIKHDMTQMDLAGLLGYESTGTISLIESGQKGMDHEKIRKAAQVFGVQMSFLMSEKQLNDEQLDMMINLQMLLDDPTNRYYQAIKATLETAAADICDGKKKK